MRRSLGRRDSGGRPADDPSAPIGHAAIASPVALEAIRAELRCADSTLVLHEAATGEVLLSFETDQAQLRG